VKERIIFCYYVRVVALKIIGEFFFKVCLSIGSKLVRSGNTNTVVSCATTTFSNAVVGQKQQQSISVHTISPHDYLLLLPLLVADNSTHGHKPYEHFLLKLKNKQQ